MQAKLLFLLIGLAALVSTSLLSTQETASAQVKTEPVEISADDRQQDAA